MRQVPASALTAVALSALLLGGCTTSDTDGGLRPEKTSATPDGSATAADPDSPDAPTGPDCDAVWRAGETLPADYSTCVAGSQPGPQDVTDCVDGSRLVVFDDVLWAVTGQQVVEPDAAPLQDTEAYGAAFATCTGE